jgi:fumarate hydratase subunit alpha
MQLRKLEEIIFELIRKVETELPMEVIYEIRKAKDRENSEIGRKILESILQNIEIAADTRRPICQDTGTLTFFIKMGSDFPLSGKLKRAILSAVEKATTEIPLRSNTVDPVTGKNTGDNIGSYIPYVDLELSEGRDCEITLLAKGGGSENMSALKMFNPTDTLDDIKRFVVDHIVEAAGKPCPPTIVGVGIGGGSDLSLKIAKKALLRPLDKRHPNSEISRLEREIIELANRSGIGPMGLGGRTTVLDVHIEIAHRHPASLPVGIVMQCWAHRYAKVKIHGDGRVEWIK